MEEDPSEGKNRREVQKQGARVVEAAVEEKATEIQGWLGSARRQERMRKQEVGAPVGATRVGWRDSARRFR